MSPRVVLCKKPRCVEPVAAFGMCQGHNDNPKWVIPTPEQVERRAAKAAVDAERKLVKVLAKAKIACRAGDCFTPSYAKGYCRKHYARVQRYGDPNAFGHMGGPKYTPTVLEDARLSLRQLQHWHHKGYLLAPLDPKGNRRNWNTTEVRVALVIQRLMAVGLTLEVAAKCAREAVVGGGRRQRLGPRIHLTVTEGPEAAEIQPW